MGIAATDHLQILVRLATLTLPVPRRRIFKVTGTGLISGQLGKQAADFRRLSSGRPTNVPSTSARRRGVSLDTLAHVQPSLIRATANSSLTLLGEEGRGTPQALLLAWVSWEGLKIRILVVGLAMRGWKVQDVYEVLSEDKVHTHAHIRGLLKEVFGSYPENIKGIGYRWEQIEEFRTVRNRYVHGTRGAAPLRLEAGTHMITDHVLDPTWLAPLPVLVDGVQKRLGDPYRRLPSLRPRFQSKASLKELVERAKPRR